MQALTHCDANVMSTRTTVGQFKCQFKGAMEDMSGKVQNANTHSLQCQNHEQAHSSRSVQGPVSKGAMEDMSGQVQNANTHLLQCQNHERAHSGRSV